jgi:hypothetical protein
LHPRAEAVTISWQRQDREQRVLGELETDTSTSLPDVRRALANDNLQSPSKKQKDGSTTLLPPLLGREPWFPPVQEEEIVLDFQFIGPAPVGAAAAAAESSTEAADATTAESQSS